MSRNRLFAAAATVAVLLGLAFGFHEAGSPGLQRLANADQVRIQDLDALSASVRGHYAVYHKLPQTLGELGNGTLWRRTDPETKIPYDYRTLDERRFELCAVFATDNSAEADRARSIRVHAAGRRCFIYPE